MNERVAKRYARALFETAQSGGLLDKVSEELAQIEAMMKTNDELRFFILSPLVARDKKRDAVGRVFGSFSPLTQKFMGLLIDKKREDTISLVRIEFERLREDASGLLRAVIQSAKPLSPELRAGIIQRLEAQSGRRLLATDEVVPELLGGVRVQIGDVVLDGSVRGDLKRLRERFIDELAKRV